ncbi:FAD/NAD(P)-binding protein [Allorhizobium sp. BGMRC 0089]|uniref:FAD/NAD(P)-binding protein n=1 Tax=Allorhizobium sonneratiae TaxID=2934936 RepID=UPI002034A478|nr:FAD/NAD(P)-binding protein [Allorhizobium sonneratiae]MCM2294602.1 FAD/NAD(P)-binding protein [Allorhizobium sonneratiae]
MTVHIAIIGGGASAAILSANLMKGEKREHLRITIIEAQAPSCRGLAYDTPFTSHALNVRAGHVSAFADAPDHFLDWVNQQDNRTVSREDFVPRPLYGHYLESLLPKENTPRLRRIHQECIGLACRENGVEITLKNGTVLPVHFAVLATGYGLSAATCSPLLSPWKAPLPTNPDSHVCLVGTGLTMVDTALALQDGGHRGPIIAFSRKAFLPLPHLASKPLALSTADIPLGASIHYFTRWLTQLVKAHEAAGGDWRDIVDGLRPHIQTIWKNLPVASRSRFLRHAATLWDIHRHKMPPSQARRIAALLGTGQLQVRRGRFIAAEKRAGKTIIQLGIPPSHQVETLEIDHAYDCRGVRRLLGPCQPLIAALVETGQARRDPLGLALDFTPDLSLISADGRSSSRIFGIGPVTFATFWETTAIPEIRTQASHLADLLHRKAGTDSAL